MKTRKTPPVFLLATVLGALAGTNLSASILTLTGTPASSGTNGGLSWAGLTAVSNGVNTIDISGSFTCSSNCPSSTLAFYFSGSGFATGVYENGTFAGTVTAATFAVAPLGGGAALVTPQYQGSLNISNTAVSGGTFQFINTGVVSGNFDDQLTSQPLSATSFTGLAQISISAISDNTTFTVTDAQVSFGPAATPEPGSLPLMAAGLILLWRRASAHRRHVVAQS